MSSARRRMMMQVLGGGKEYIEFVDPAVEAICIANWSSDGIGVTMQDAARVTSLGTYFKNNSSIVSFDELEYFINATTWPVAGSGGNANGVFYNCTGLQSITLPDSIVTINNASFKSCSNLETVDGGNITVVEQYAFHNCAKLKDIDLSKASSLGLMAFYKAGPIELNAPSLTTLGQGCFFNSKITKIVDLGSITSIPRDNNGSNGGCFNKCTSLTSVVLPDTLTYIGQYAFAGCSNLESINLPSSLTTLEDYVFSGDSKLSMEVYLPNVTSMAREVFRETKITKAVFGKLPSLAGSTYGVFYNCKSLTYVDLPDTITSIGQAAFRGCSALATLICRATTPPTLGSNVFLGNPSSQKIYVPNGYGNAYKSASGWSSYSSKIYELNPDGTIPS